ncbi:alkaline phosphatase D family protein [Maribacter sp. 2307ULW6-5]|uniref:alkaline phosphatase D family protein n=1 Tax=Maribacter sp. 2307ULW6-5 TaxID=3386275 RepID=UPI0039BC9E09
MHPKLLMWPLVAALLLTQCNTKQPKKDQMPLVRPPFEHLDTLATNDWWNRAPNPIIDLKVDRDSVLAFGIYTLSNDILKLSAQAYPLYPDEDREVHLEIYKDRAWQRMATERINDLGWSATFKMTNWDSSRDWPYRLRHGKNATYTGTIRKDPKDKAVISMAALSCNSNKDRGMRNNYVRNINHQDPDIIFFSGDQSYDHSEHTAAWLKFGKQFRETFRHRPCITIPDDHDIGQGNLWGEGGKKSVSKGGPDGGYTYHPEYVNMVERCQTAHLPDPYDATPVDRGIGVYYTNLLLGGVDFAILEDRKFKSGPEGKIPQQGPRPDHIRDPEYEPSSIDLPGLTLLGKRQLDFLEDWGQDNPTHLKVVLSQTGFCGGAHIHGRPDNRLHADLDSNGWPQTGRNKALALIKKANAVHVAGDQHLATVIRHGIEEFRDGPWAFVVPAIVNDYYSRWWWPEEELPGANPNTATSLPWTGDYVDGFGNKISIMAYANPESDSYGAGYGLIKFNTETRETTFECWPREADVTQANASQFEGWPIVVPHE